MTDCSHDCKSCNESCAERDLHESLHANSKVDKVYAVVSGKGGVGKSLVTSLLTVQAQRLGYRTAIIDADITGPSIPKIFGAKGDIFGDEEQGFIPVESKGGTQMISTNFLLSNETDPVVWRGPIIAGTIKQFWSCFRWDNIDVMFIDMPPGTADIPLTVFQSIRLDGIIIVTSPQELVSMIVAKAVKMAEMMNIPIIGLVENMAYFHCPDCGADHRIFGDSHVEEIARQHGLKLLASLPIDPDLTALGDTGRIEEYRGELLLDVVRDLMKDAAK